MLKISIAVLALSLPTLFAQEMLYEQQPTVEEVANQNAFKNWQGKVGSASVESGLFYDFSFLYLKAGVDGLSLGETINVGALSNPNQVLDVKVRPKDLDFHWDPGVSVGVGYIFPQREQWQLSGYWTYLHSKADTDVKINGQFSVGNRIAPGWIPLILGADADKASANWALNFNVADLALSRNAFFGKWLSLEPRVGLRAVWINQDYSAKYRAAFPFSDGGVNGTFRRNTSFVASNDFSGIGARVGTDMNWYLSENFSILGGVFASLVYGNFEIKEIFNGAVINDFGGGPQLLNEKVDLRSDFDALRPALEAKIGLTWHKFFNDDAHRILLGAFYQFDFWFSQNELINEFVVRDRSPIGATAINTGNLTQAVSSHGHLQMQGLQAELRIDF